MKNFINRWRDKGDEKSDTHTFWLDLLHTVFNLENPGELIEFEKRVGLKHVSYIIQTLDLYRIILKSISKGVISCPNIVMIRILKWEKTMP